MVILNFLQTAWGKKVTIVTFLKDSMVIVENTKCKEVTDSSPLTLYKPK